MPELPEVENAVQSLVRLKVCGQKLAGVELRRENLRTPLDPTIGGQLRGQMISSVHRRGKFILFHLEKHVLLNHLGMSGAWRGLQDDEEIGLHDHVILRFENGFSLVYRDPRRFGLLELYKETEVTQSRWLKGLGIEPLDVKAFTGEYLYAISRGQNRPVKSFLMDQACVVGVGNIYASEVLFGVGIRPTRPTRLLTRGQCENLVDCIRKVLKRAIRAGGSTIRDYQNSERRKGSFQNQLQVYGRAEQGCRKCQTPIRSAVVGGRSTFWCSTCQK